MKNAIIVCGFRNTGKTYAERTLHSGHLHIFDVDMNGFKYTSTSPRMVPNSDFPRNLMDYIAELEKNYRITPDYILCDTSTETLELMAKLDNRKYVVIPDSNCRDEFTSKYIADLDRDPVYIKEHGGFTRCIYETNKLNKDWFFELQRIEEVARKNGYEIIHIKPDETITDLIGKEVFK
jgi:hypothetical protein